MSNDLGESIKVRPKIHERLTPTTVRQNIHEFQHGIGMGKSMRKVFHMCPVVLQ